MIHFNQLLNNQKQQVRLTRLTHIVGSLCMGAALAVLTACGGGGGGTSNTPSTPVTAFVTKAPITGGACRLYNAANQVLAGPVAASNGAVSFNMVSGVSTTSTDVFYVECVGGQYLDEATGQQVTLTSLKAPALLDSGGTSRTAVITPLTHLAWMQAGGDLTQLTAKAAQIATAFGISGVDLFAVTPTNLNTTAASSNDAGKYGTVLASIAQYMKDNSLNLTAALSNLNAAITNGQMGGSVAQNMAAALAHLTDITYNNNAAVRGNTSATLATTVTDNLLNNSGVVVPKITTTTQTMNTTQGVSLIAGGTGGTWTLDGTSLGSGFAVKFNGTACTSSGNVNVAGIQVTGVDCRNVQTSVGQTTATLTFTQPSSSANVAAMNETKSITLSAAPAPTLSVTLTIGGSNGTTVQRGSTQAVQVTSLSNSSGLKTFASSDLTVATVDASTGVVTVLDKTGSTTLSVSQAAVPGSYAAATQTVTLTVTDRTVPTGGFSGIANSAKTIVMGSAPYTAAASFSCTTQTNYTPSYTYSSSDTLVATVTSTGEVTHLKAGTATITVTVGQVGTCDQTQAAYTLTVDKATPSVSFASSSIPSMVINAVNTTTATVAGVGGSFPSVVATISYASSNPSVATVSNTGLVTAIAAGTATITATLTGSDPNYQLSSANAAITASYTVDVETGYSVGATVTTYNPNGGDVSGLVVQINVNQTAQSAGTSEQFSISAGSSLQNGGSFTFPTNLATGSTYLVKVITHATGKVCSIQSASGTVTNSVTNITIECSFMPYIKVDSLGNDIHYSYWQSGSVTTWCAVKHPATGLMWQNHVNAQSAVTHDLAGGPGTALGYIDARNTAQDCSFSDWRLPSLIGTDSSYPGAPVVDGTVSELETLAYMRANGTTFYGLFFQNWEANYWSSVHRSNDNTYAWYQSFHPVLADPYYAPRSSTGAYFVRAVRTY